MSIEKTKRIDVEKIVLSSIYAAGVLSLALLVPNATRLLVTSVRKAHPKYTIKRATDNLLHKNMLKRTSIGGEERLVLTRKGERSLSLCQKHDFKLKKPKTWDEKWRLIIFDIPERRRKTRDQVRLILRQIGFVRLQQSVWIYPYPCEHLIVLLKAEFRVGQRLLYLVVESLEGDFRIRKSFGLA